MREEVIAARRVRLEKFLNKIENNVPPPHLASRWAKTLIELHLGLQRAEDCDWPNSKITLSDSFSPLNDDWMHMYVHTPVQKRIAEVLNELRKGNKATVEKMLQKIMSTEAGKEIQSEIQTLHRAKRTRNQNYHTLLDQIYKSDPAIGHRKLLQRLKKEIGKGVIRIIDEPNNLIHVEGGDEFAITGLKDQISDRRKLN
jgi:hypothetical protein